MKNEEPKPLNFDHDKEKGPGDRLKKPFSTPADNRGDDQEEQYYQEEESISPEETELRKKEGNM